MAKNLSQPLKAALRQRMKNEILKCLTEEVKQRQSKAIKEKVLQHPEFRAAQRISIYLSTVYEVDTIDLLKECLRLDKHVFVPSYDMGPSYDMEMLRLRDFNDYQSLPSTKWNIKQPCINDVRENALTNGHGIDLFLIPGVAFTLTGRRLGHGMAYYDTYLKRHYNVYPQKKVTLMALAFREQIVTDNELPLEEHDVRLHCIMTE